MKEYFLSCWHLILLSFGMGVAVAPAARAADITFNVNLHYQAQLNNFTAGTDAVSVVVGSSTVPLSDPDGDKIYSGTLTGQTTDAQITYNYRFTHGGSTVNESSPARRYVVQSYSSANVLDDWWNDQQPTNYPYADFYASSVKVIPGEIVRFNDSSQGAGGTLTWTFTGGNPGSGTGSSPTTTWASPGTYAVTLKAEGGGVTTTKTINVTVVSATADVLGWWNDAVFYQLYPRSFFDTGGITDSRNGGGIGDFQGMIQKLDYLNDGNASTTTDLGVTALYVMPIHDATNPGFGGYEVIDYKSVIAELGSKADFDQFVAAAHSRGMKVILDMVFNHTSLNHQWFQQGMTGNGQYNNYYVHQGPGQPSGPWHSNTYSSTDASTGVGTGVNHSDASYNYFYGWFGEKTPELNYNVSSVRNAIKDASKYWLDQKVDGFRLDAPMFLYERGTGASYEDQENLPATYTYWRSWRKYLKDNPGSQQANPFSVGETWLPNRNDIPTAAKYVYQGFDIGFQFDVAYGVQNALNNNSKSALQDKVEQAMQYYPFLQFGVMLSNHDMGANGDGGTPRRFKDRLTDAGNKDAKIKVAATFLLTTPGVPFVYFGDEVGAGGGDWARSPMRWTPGTNAGFTTASQPWEAIASEYTTYNVQTQDATAGSILKLYRTLVRTRLASTALRQGKYTTVSNPSAAVYTFVRTAGSETVFVILNMSAQAQSNVALSVSLPNGVPNGTYNLTNLLDASQPAAASVTVSNGAISNWVPFATLGANAYYVLKLNVPSGGPNSSPTIDAVAAQSLNVESGVSTISLTGISDGDYCAQTVTVTATSSATGVVSTPAVTYTSCNSTGTLKLTPVAAGTSTITVTVKDNGGTANGGVDTKTITFTATVTDVPKAPTGLTLSQASPTSVAVGWADNSSRETGYRIYWSTGSAKPSTANATVAANATSYTATGLSTQTTYNFWVEAYNGNGTSAAITGSFTLTLPNLALNKPASASNVETYNGVTYTAAMAVDGIDQNFNNRWSAPVTSAGNTQTEWIKVDLGASYNLSKVLISWENANADSYYIMASNSNVTPDPANAAWSKVNYTGLPNQMRTDNQSLNLTGRYLAIYCYHKSQQYGYSIYELQAYGLAATGNQAPNASAGANQTLPYTATSATLDASGSNDPEGSALTYTWSQTSGPNTATFSSKTVAKPTVSGLAVGSYVFQVSVSDGSLASTAQVTVTVKANQAPVASAGANQSLAAGTTSATLDASGSTDPEGSALTYTWSQSSGPNTAAFSSKTVAKPTVSGLTAGSYVFQVSVSDGSLASTAQVTVTVAASSGGATSYYIINRWKGTYLVDNGSSQVAYTAATTSSSAKWTLETVGSYERIRNVATGNYMNVENLGANVQCTNVPSSFTSGQWAREAVSGTSYYRIRNNWQSGAYIHVENQTGFAQYGSVDVSYYSGHWTFQPTTGARSAAGPLAATAAAAPASLEVYPNPVTTGRLTVQVPGTAATAQVRLYDGQGRLVLSQAATLAAGQLELSVARCSAGLYLLQVEADGTVYAQKLLVQ